MNEIGILRILYRNRLRLLVVSLAVGVIAGMIALLIPNKYGSTAAIAVQKPEVPVTGEVSPLQVEALRSLTESTLVKKEVYDGLKADELLPRRVDFTRFLEMLSTQVQRVEGQERALLPLVQLTATTSDPSLSREIADRWASTVLDTTREIYRSGVDELGEFTARMYEEINRSLLESEDRYSGVRLEVNLEGNKLALEHNREIYSRLLKKVLELEEKASAGESMLKQLESRLADQEIEGIWIGELSSPGEGSEGESEIPIATPLGRRIVRAVRILVRNEDQLAEFKQTSQIDYKEARAKLLATQVDELSQEVLQARGELSRIEPVQQRLAEELKDLKPTVTLRKALGDDVLLTLAERGKKGEDFPSLETDVSNPVYEEIRAETIRLSGQVEGLKNKIKRGGEQLEEFRKELSQLNRELISLTARQRTYWAAVERDRELLDFFRGSYREDRRKYEELKKELELEAAELASARASLENTSGRISALEEEVYAGEMLVSRLERDVENLANVRSSLAARAEEVQLLRVSTEKTSRSGTFLLYGAEEDPVKVGPRRARAVLISVLFGFLLYSLILVLRSVLEEPEPERSAPPTSN